MATSQLDDALLAATKTPQWIEHVDPQTGSRYAMWGTKHYDLSAISQVQKYKIQASLKELTKASDALADSNPKSASYGRLLENKVRAKESFYKMLSPYDSTRKQAPERPPTPPPIKSPPSPGEIINGYKFKGGDPADQNNYEQVK